MPKYQYFKIQPGMTASDMKQQYRDLSKKYHPDVNDGNQHDFVEVKREYEQIKNYLKKDGTIDFKIYLLEEFAFATGQTYEEFVKPTVEPLVKFGLFFKMEQQIDKLPEWLKPIVSELRMRTGFDQRIEQFSLGEILQKLDMKKATDTMKQMNILKKSKKNPEND